MIRRRYRNKVILNFTLISLFFIYVSGLYQYLFTLSYDAYYTHNGPTESLSLLVSQLQNNLTDGNQPINIFSHQYIFTPKQKCKSVECIRILFVITSIADNLGQRKSIRKTWGDESRFTDVTIRRVFLLGMKSKDELLQSEIEMEANINKDIIQGKFEESDDNLTSKTMMGLDWAFNHCKNVSYYFFTNDNFYISTRNILRYIRNPMHYPNYLQNYAAISVNEIQNLYAGRLYNYSMPIRYYFSKSYVSLEDFPYSYWPPYINGGFYVLSRKALEKLYYGSIYTKPFRMQDIFLGMAAKKAGLKLLNQNEILLYSRPSSLDNYPWLLAANGFHDKKLIKTWNEQRATGNA